MKYSNNLLSFGWIALFEKVLKLAISLVYVLRTVDASEPLGTSHCFKNITLESKK